MQALVYDGQMLRLATDVRKPVPGAGEALLQVHMAGVCNTDLEILGGYADYVGVLGH
ncbi:MAG: alcohol dehydrogenase, partial [Chloroflexi bacterium]|nr:alcohol dehydrogenase [Chloroflexota bacterium]